MADYPVTRTNGDRQEHRVDGQLPISICLGVGTLSYNNPLARYGGTAFYGDSFYELKLFILEKRL